MNERHYVQYELKLKEFFEKQQSAHFVTVIYKNLNHLYEMRFLDKNVICVKRRDGEQADVCLGKWGGYRI